jgi:hypothetical protein
MAGANFGQCLSPPFPDPRSCRDWMRHPDAGIGINPYSANEIYRAFGHCLHEAYLRPSGADQARALVRSIPADGLADEGGDERAGDP